MHIKVHYNMAVCQITVFSIVNAYFGTAVDYTGQGRTGETGALLSDKPDK